MIKEKKSKIDSMLESCFFFLKQKYKALSDTNYKQNS